MKTKKTRKPRVLQGDIIRNVEYIEYAREISGVIQVSKIVYPVSIVLTQDCDLSQDYTNRKKRSNSNQDKYLLSIIMAPIYNAEHIYEGTHLSELGLSMRTINRRRTEGTNISQNQTPRYHFLHFPEETPVVDSIIDFKHYYCVSTGYLENHKKQHFICQVSELYREFIAQRFAAYLSRIGLP